MQKDNIRVVGNTYLKIFEEVEEKERNICTVISFFHYPVKMEETKLEKLAKKIRIKKKSSQV